MRADLRRAVLLGVLGLGLTHCNGCGNGCGKERPNGPPGNLPALVAKLETAPLPVPGFLDAVVSIPTGATRAMPVVVAVLGIGDTPEEQCEAWRDIVGGRAFVLCPRGAKHYVLPEEEDGGAPSSAPGSAAARASVAPPAPAPAPGPTAAPSATAAPPLSAPPAPSEPPEIPSAIPKLAPPRMVMQVKPSAGEPRQVGFFPVDVPTLDRELLAAMGALKQRFGQYVGESWVYAGFSRGAFLGASIVALHPDRFGRAILIEGGQSAWTAQSAASFAARGGKRVLFACGQGSCLDESNPAAALLKGQRTETRVVIGQGEGHGYKRQVKEELKKNFDWVVEGDPSWAH